MTIGESYEEKFKEAKYECVQNQIVLTNSSAKVLKEKIKSPKYIALSDFTPTRANVFNSSISSHYKN